MQGAREARFVIWLPASCLNVANEVREVSFAGPLHSEHRSEAVAQRRPFQHERTAQAPKPATRESHNRYDSKD